MILIYENNLFWSLRLKKGVEALGEPAHVYPSAVLPTEGRLAILNLGVPEFADASFLGELRSRGIVTVGHAGHKETAMIEGGKDAGCQHVVSNSTLTHKLADVLKLV